MTIHNRRILVTGANGFIGKNLVVRLKELPECTYATFVRGDDRARLFDLVAQADAIVHLAAVNRPPNDNEFSVVNEGLTSDLCDAIKQEYISMGRHIPVLLASSTQVENDSPYGRSKLSAEKLLNALSQSTDNPCVVFRLPGVFGKWCKPNYNSVVATFCYNLARNLPIQISDPNSIVRLVYIDDVINAFLKALECPSNGYTAAEVVPDYKISLCELAEQIRAFAECRTSLMTERVGTGLLRALYATYMSYLPDSEFEYAVPEHADTRGVFVEMLKTADNGQISYFTAHPGITRGGHYHHTKTEKFLVVKGKARFRFRHLLTDELVEMCTCGAIPKIVDTIPGWSHEITNVGDNELIVMLWSNENFDPLKPDTIASKV